MRKRYAALLAGLLGLMLVGAPPAAAQSDPAPVAEIPGTVTHRLPVPRSYPRDQPPAPGIKTTKGPLSL